MRRWKEDTGISMEYPRVSVVINTLNRADSLAQTLLSLGQLRYPNFELVVVHGPCGDHTTDVLARFAPMVRICTCPEANLAMSRNIGVVAAEGDIVAFLDDDAIPEPDWLDRLVPAFKDPGIAAVGGFIRDRDGVRFQCKVVIADRLGEAKKHAEVPHLLDRHHYLSLTGTNVAFRRDALLSIGGFDEEYAYFLDETDVNLRLVDSGWRLTMAPDAEVHHKFAASHIRGRGREPRSTYLIARSKSYYCWVNASEFYSAEELERHLQVFRDNRHRRIRHFRRAGKINAELCQRLIAEVDHGIEDGARDARLTPRRLPLSPLMGKQPSELSAFKSYLKPALSQEPRLRICMISGDNSLGPSGDTAELRTRQAAAELVARGHEVTVICHADRHGPKVEFIDGVWVHSIVASRVSIWRRAECPAVLRPMLRFGTAATNEILRIQSRRQFDVLVGPLPDVAVVRTLRRLGFPTIATMRLPHPSQSSPPSAFPGAKAAAAMSVEALEQRMIRVVAAHHERRRATVRREPILLEMAVPPTHAPSLLRFSNI